MKRIFNKINHIILLAKNISVKASMFEFLSSIFGIKNQFGKKMTFLKHEAVKDYLYNEYREIIDKYKNKKETSKLIENDTIIWIFWWQGCSEMPYLIKKCIKSIRTQMLNHEVVIVDKNNFYKYINIPKEILDLVKNGNITLTLFSDYVRLSLLADYGGLWLDSTIFLSKNIDDLLANKTFFSIRHNQDSDTHVCKGKWFVSVLATGEDSKLFKFSKEMMENVIIKEKFVVTYLLIDCILSIAYESFEDIQMEIDSVETNNVEFIALASNMNNRYSEKIENLLNNQAIHKLSYKDTYSNNTMLNGSVYEKIIYEESDRG